MQLVADLEPNTKFQWRGETFTLTDKENAMGNLIVIDKLGNELPFNPYTRVEPITEPKTS